MDDQNSRWGMPNISFCSWEGEEETASNTEVDEDPPESPRGNGNVQNPVLSSPFAYDEGLTTYEKRKIIVMCILLVPLIRVILVSFILFLCAILCLVSTVGINRDRRVNLQGWRLFTLRLLSPMCRLILFVLGFYYIPSKGRRSREASIVVSNHVTLLDVFYFGYAISPPPAAVGKKSILKMPIVGRIASAIQMIPVDRSTPEGRKEAMKRISEWAKQGTRKNIPPLVVFPQGTTSRDDCLSMFKSGAFVPGRPVQPVTLRFPYVNFCPAFAAMKNSKLYLLRSLCQFVQYLEVTWLPVYHPTEEEKKNPQVYANKVRSLMARELNVPTTNHSYEDCLLYKQAKKLELPPQALSLFEIENHREIFGKKSLDLTGAKELLHKFKQMDTSGDGKISFEEFKTALGMESSRENARKLFNFFDLDGDESIDFRELACGMALYSADMEARARFAFSVFDREESGFLSMEGVMRVLRAARGGLTTTIEQEDVERIFADSGLQKDARISEDQFVELASNGEDDIINLALRSVNIDHLHQTTDLERLKRRTSESSKAGEDVRDIDGNVANDGTTTQKASNKWESWGVAGENLIAALRERLGWVGKGGTAGDQRTEDTDSKTDLKTHLGRTGESGEGTALKPLQGIVVDGVPSGLSTSPSSSSSAPSLNSVATSHEHSHTKKPATYSGVHFPPKRKVFEASPGKPSNFENVGAENGEDKENDSLSNQSTSREGSDIEFGYRSKGKDVKIFV